MDKTKSEMWDFLMALNEYGSNVDVLQAVLPGWTKAHLEHAMKRYRYRAKRKLAGDEGTTRDASLNLWAKIVEYLHQLQGSTNHPWWRKGRQMLEEEPRDHPPTLSKIMLYIAKYEKHYQGSGPDDPNYSEIYQYLSQLLKGDEPTQMSPGSAAKILEMVNRIKKVVTDPSILKYHRHLQNMEVSYLPSVPVVAPKTAKRKASSMKETSSPNREDVTEEDSLCPLYEDSEREDVRLEPSDPYYELKREKMMKKIKTAQHQEATNLLLIPGLNPMDIPLDLLVKPTCSLLDP